jgi:hypothetical protein
VPRRLKIREGERAASRSAPVIRYALAWLAGGAATAALLVVLLAGDDDVALPPVKQTKLEDAARSARCELRRASRTVIPDPPVDGPGGAAPLAAGVHEDPAPRQAIIAALRVGSIVVEYRPGLDETSVEQLEDLQLAVPEATIVVPGDGSLRYEVAVTAWRRLLACPDFDDEAIDALRLFRGRFIGRGPDRP